jgi:predicted AlkP superfamily pyrophosphatase or phosphodiesterase
LINLESLSITDNLAFGQHFIRPAYGSYCFAHLPDTIKSLFGLDHDQGLPAAVFPNSAEFPRVIVILVDGMGWQFFERALAESAFLRHLEQLGVVSRLTSMFPSTTAAHVTCLNTGLPVAQSGVYEWFYYEPKLDQVIAPLLFSPAGENTRELLAEQGVLPGDLLPQPTLYQALEQGGVKSFSFTFSAYSHSSYNTHISRSAQIVPYTTWSEALTNLGLLLEQTSERMYALLYFSNLDTIAHPYGPGGPHLMNEMDTFWLVMAHFFERLQRSAQRQRTLLLITADHGIVSTNPATTVYLNLRLPDLVKNLRCTRRGEPILFGGSPRDLFLYVQEGSLAEVHSCLQSDLAGLAEVYQTRALVESGIFGQTKLTEPLASRLGNLVILPFQGEAVYWYERDRFEQRYFGHHGGLTPQEMLIPFLACPLS